MVLNLPGFNQLTGFQYLKIRNEGGLDIPNIIINRPFELEFGEIATPEGIEDDSALKVTNGINYFPEPFNGNTLNSIFWTEAGDVSVTDGIFSIIVDFGTAFSTLSFALQSPPSDGNLVLKGRVRRNIAANGAGKIRFGFETSLGSTTHYAEYKNENDDIEEWTPETKGAGPLDTNGATRNITNNTWVNFEIEVSTTYAKFNIDGQKSNITTNLPTQDMAFFISILRDTDDIQIDLEWLSIEYTA